MFKRIVRILDLLIFPRNCIGCGKTDATLCNRCVSSLKISREYRDQFTHSLFSYDDVLVRKAILRLKFANDQTIIGSLAPFLADLILDILSETLDQINDKDILIIPIPISKKSLKVRGYNQSSLIGQEVSRITGFMYDDKSLIKIRETRKQAKIKNRNERKKNVIGSFLVSDSFFIKDKTIFLIDDVVTTGSTLNEARGVLLRAGAKRVYCITLASQPLK